jgi:signal transduction histidine kinase
VNIREIQESKDLFVLKSLSFFSVATYWTWYFYYQSIFPDVQDFLYSRVAISLFSGLIFYALQFQKISLVKIQPFVVFALWIHVANEAHLIARNDWNPIFQLSYLGISLIVSSLSLRMKDFLFLGITAIALPIVIHLFFRPTQTTYLVHLSIINLTIFSVVGFMLRSNFSYRKEIMLHHLNSVQNSKMAALGQMASGMAHEINNPLSIIKGRADLIVGKISRSQTPPDRDWLIGEMKKISLTVERIAKIIKGLRAFSRNSEDDAPAPVYINELISNTLELCQEKIKQRNINLDIDPVPAESILGRESQLVQVLLNLIGNAIDALDNSDNKTIEVRFLLLRDNLQIRVTDYGPPISSEIIHRLMEPFFTTKEAGKGTGLGLSISKGILESHQGRLYFDKASKNTCFVMELPRLKRNPSDKAA